MNREEILEKSRLENKKLDERELGIHLDAKRLGSYAGFIILVAIWVYHIMVLFDHSMQTEVFMIISSTIIVECTYLYAKLRKTKDLVFALIGLAIFVLEAVVFLTVR